MPLLRISRPGARRRPPPAAPDAPLLLPTVVDQIAPRSVEVSRDALRLDDSYAASLAVTGLPRTTLPGQLLRLLAAGLPLDFAVHLRPIAAATARRFLDRQATVHGSGRSVALASGTIDDPGRDTALEDIQTLRLTLERGQERLFRVSLYALARARSSVSLDQRGNRLRTLLEGAGLRVRRTVLQQREAFRSCLPQGTNLLDDEHYLSAGALATLIPWSVARLAMPGGFLWGLAYPSRTPVRINLFANPPLTNAHVLVMAQVRKGKSFLLKLLVRRQLALHGGRAVVVDAEPQQEYRPLCEDLDGQYVRLGAGSTVRINPFDLPPYDPNDDELRDPVREHIAGSLLPFLQLLLGERSKALGADELAILDLALGITYVRAAGGTPLMADLLAVLRHPAEHLPDADPALVRSLAIRLARYVAGSLSDLFSAPTNVRLDVPLTVFNVAALDDTLRPIGIQLIEHFVWTQVRRQHVLGNEEPCLLVIDELWLTLRTEAGARFLDSVARRGPKYWLGLVTATQQPGDCLATPMGAPCSTTPARASCSPWRPKRCPRSPRRCSSARPRSGC